MSAAEIRMEAMARNMSAPPRTTLSFSALAPAPPAAGEPISSGAGLRFICRLDARALTRRHRKKVGTVAAGAAAVGGFILVQLSEQLGQMGGAWLSGALFFPLVLIVLCCWIASKVLGPKGFQDVSILMRSGGFGDADALSYLAEK